MNWLQQFVIRLFGIETESVAQADYDAAVERAKVAEEKAAAAQSEAADISQRLGMLQDGMQGAIKERDTAQKTLGEVKVIYAQWKEER